MTVENLVTKNIYIGNGSTQVFPYTFVLPGNDTSFIHCYKYKMSDGITQEVNNFTVNSNTCEITYPSINIDPVTGELICPLLSNEYKLIIMRIVPVIQLTNFENGAAFFANDIEAALDTLTMIGQQMQESSDRSIKVSLASGLSNILLPVGNKQGIRWGDNGNLELTPDPASIYDSVKNFTDTAETAASNANSSAQAAAGSATSAANSKTAAETAASNANSSAAAAAGSVTSVANSKTAAETAASNANSSATAAAGSATAAANSKTAAETAASSIDLSNYYDKAASDNKFAVKNNAELSGVTKGNFVENVQALGTISAATTIDCTDGAVVTATLGAALTFTFAASASATTCRVLTLILTNGGAYTITWPSVIKWAAGTAPTLTASGKDILHFITVDNGATWYGCLGGSAFA